MGDEMDHLMHAEHTSPNGKLHRKWTTFNNKADECKMYQAVKEEQE